MSPEDPTALEVSRDVSCKIKTMLLFLSLLSLLLLFFYIPSFCILNVESIFLLGTMVNAIELLLVQRTILLGVTVEITMVTNYFLQTWTLIFFR